MMFRGTFVLLMVFGVLMRIDPDMFSNKIQKAQSMMLFVMMLVMGNEFGNKRKGMCCFPRQGDYQNKEEYSYFLQAFHRQ